MTLPELSIRRPVFAWMLMASLIIFGGVAFTRMGVSQLPDVDFPVLSVSLTYEGASPEVMETEIVDVVENALSTIQGVKSVTSTSRLGSATVAVEFELERDIDLALQDVQAKIAETQRRLPREMDPPTIRKTNPDDQPILWLGVNSDRHTPQELMSYVRDILQPYFATTSGVGDVQLGGYVDPNLRVWVNSKDLDRYQLAVGDVLSAIQTEHSEPPAGVLVLGEKEVNVRTLGEAKSLEEFRKIVVNSRGGAPNFLPISLDKISRIEDGLADVRRQSRAMGRPAVGIGIRKQRGSNAVGVAHAVKERMAKIAPQLPDGMVVAVNFDNTVFIEEAIGELVMTLVLSALLTALVCAVFLGSFSSTVNVVLSIPTSIVGTFLILYFSGFTLNTFTLLGLSLAIGIVVDDAIMVLENIIRHRERGLGREEAALVGSKEISFAAIAATVSIVAIFLPVAFMKGAIGKFFFQFGVTMTAAVLLSLLEALTLTPMRCAQFVEAGTERTSRLGRGFEAMMAWTQRTYTRTLGKAIDHRWWVLGASIALFLLSFFVVRLLNFEFLPQEDQSRFMLRLQTPVGSSLSFTDGKMREVEDFLLKRREISRYFGSVGGFGGGDVNTAMMFVTLRNKGSRGTSPEFKKEPSQLEFMTYCRKELSKIPNLKIVAQDLSARGFTASRGFPVEFAIRGADWEQLGKASEKITADLEKTGLMTDVDTDYRVGMPELQITPDREKAARRGVSIAAIGQTVNALVAGVVTGRYEKGGHRYDIRLKLDEEEGPITPKRIGNLFVRNNRGELVRLSEVVTLKERPTLLTIARKDRMRAVTVSANVTPGMSQEKALAAAAEVAKQNLPDGYQVVFTGGSESFKDARNSLVFALLIGILVAYMVLGSQFNSFLHPITVLLALPFSVTGAFVAMYIAGQSLNIYSMIGLILLMGIVKKNSILLVEFTNHLRHVGVSKDGQPWAEETGHGRPPKDVKEALTLACPLRLRPILMTSFATIVGAIPAALAWGPGAESRIPMAVAVIGGTFVSTFLTLFVVPCAYRAFARLDRQRYLGDEKPVDLGVRPRPV